MKGLLDLEKNFINVRDLTFFIVKYLVEVQRVHFCYF